MYIGDCPIPGPHARVPFTRILPPPSEDILRRLWRFVFATGLTIDPLIEARDRRIQHCIVLPTAGMLVTATRAHAPLLEPNCAVLAEVTNLDVLLLRFGPMSDPGFASEEVRACLIKNDPRERIVAREGYRASVPPQGGIMLRHPLPDKPDWHVNNQGIMMSVGADFHMADASTPRSAASGSD